MPVIPFGSLGTIGTYGPQGRLNHFLAGHPLHVPLHQRLLNARRRSSQRRTSLSDYTPGHLQDQPRGTLNRSSSHGGRNHALSIGVSITVRLNDLRTGEEHCDKLPAEEVAPVHMGHGFDGSVSIKGQDNVSHASNDTAGNDCVNVMEFFFSPRSLD